MQDTSEGRPGGTPLSDWRRRLLPSVALCAVYTIAARAGLSFASIHPSASAVWPPTGIAIAAVVMLGSWVWPAILAGAFVVNLMTAGSVVTSLGIAIGNTLEAVVAGYLVVPCGGR